MLNESVSVKWLRYNLLWLISLLSVLMADAQTDSLPHIAEHYQWISYRGKADITDTGGVRSCNFFIVNRIDSIIYLNISVSGIEIMRAVFTPEYLTYVNKMNYNYYQGGYDPLKLILKIPLNFNVLQAMVNADFTILQRITKYSFEYDNFLPVDSTQSYFYHFRFTDLDHIISIEGNIKKVRINEPGPTGIKIPDKFNEIKLF